MKALKIFCTIILMGLLSSPVLLAQGKIDNFTANDVTKNQPFSLSEYAGEKCIIIIFTSNYCPYAKLYEQRLIKMTKTFSEEGVKFIFINSNKTDDYIDDNVDQMTKKAIEKKFTFPYLADKDQAIATKIGAIKNPSAFVLVPMQGNFIIKYKGAIDNNPQVEEDATEHYLKDAIEAVLNHKNINIAEKKPTGCVIRKD